MRYVFVVLLLLHGALHLLGPAKAFGWADLPQLSQPISKLMGVAWLVAAAAMWATVVALLAGSRGWWAVGALGLLCSQAVILTAWSDAKYGSAANLLILLGVVYGFASQGPWSLRAEYRHAIEMRRDGRAGAVVSEGDLAGVPAPVASYLRMSGALGQPRSRHLRAMWKGRIRSGPDAPWMPFEAEQHNFPDEPSRFFFMSATRAGLPVDVFHAFEGGSATMRVRLLSLFGVVDADGPELTRAETVTLLNDIALLAPDRLLDASIRWEPLDARSAKAHYTALEHPVSAVLSFGDAGELQDFVSDDRLIASEDGGHFEPRRWSTPVSAYRSFGSRRAASQGTGWWHSSEGEFAYIELELLELELDPK